MHPELFEIPFTHMTVKSYGLMMVIGFLAAVFLIRRLSRHMGHNVEHITNAALYSLVAGVVGSRLFYVLHHFEEFRGRLFSVFAIWEGGLELLGGVTLAIVIIILYMRWQKLPVRRYLDLLAIGLMAALAFGRIGCFLFGCCFGKPAELPWAVRFPYASPAFRSQVYPDYDRNRPYPHLELPAEFYGYLDANDNWIASDETNKFHADLKPKALLTEQQLYDVTKGPYRCLPVHPTQLYSSANGFFLCLVLYLFWRRAQRAERNQKFDKAFIKPGCTFALMFILYPIVRFFIEFVRDDNPFEFDGLTISQNICAALVVFGLIMMAIFAKMTPDRLTQNSKLKTQN